MVDVQNLLKDNNMVFNPDKQNKVPSQEEQVVSEMEGKENEEISDASSENVDSNKEKKSDFEVLKQVLDDARQSFAKMHQKHESMSVKIKEVLGDVDLGKDDEVSQMKAEYKTSLENYRSAKLAEIEKLPEDQQVEALKEIKSFDLSESCKLVDSHSMAKAETLGGKIGLAMNSVVESYKKLPTKYKLALSGALIVGGLATGTGVAAGIIGAATLGKKMLGAAVAGVGVAGWAEARAQQKEQKNVSQSVENFQALSIEEQKAHLSSFDNESFQKIESSFHGKLAERKRRVLLGVGAAAGVMALGAAGKIFSVHEATAAEIPLTTEASIPDGESGVIDMDSYEGSSDITAMETGDGNMDELENKLSAKIAMQESNVTEHVTEVTQTSPEVVTPKNDLVASLNKMKGSFGSVQETPSLNVQPATQQFESIQSASIEEHPAPAEDVVQAEQSPKKGLMDSLNNMRKSTVFEESHPTPSSHVDTVPPQSTVAVEHSATATAHVEQQPTAIVRETPQTSHIEKAPMGVMSISQEKAVIAELIKNPDFNKTVAGTIKALYNMPASNIAKMPMGLLEGNNFVVEEQVTRTVNLATKYLGDVGKPQPNMSIGTYFTRVAAHASQRGIPLRNIFPPGGFVG